MIVKMIKLFTAGVGATESVFGSSCRSSSCEFAPRIFEACHSITKMMAYIEFQATVNADNMCWVNPQVETGLLFCSLLY